MFKKKITSAQKKPLRLITEKAPFAYVEAYKALRTNFNFATSNGQKRIILITSTLQDEGKSGLAINLAISLVQAGSKVLLIDADMRNPSLHRYLHIRTDASRGLSTLLTGQVKVRDCLKTTEQGVDVIGSGLVPPNPTELICSDAMRELLQDMSKQYDYVICDTPPVGIITDAAALSPLCDGVLFVVRHRFAVRKQVHGAMRNLQSVNAKILGTVLTQYAVRKDGEKYGYYHYSGGYGYGYESEEK